MSMFDRLTLAAACIVSAMALNMSAYAQQQSPKLSDEGYTMCGRPPGFKEVSRETGCGSTAVMCPAFDAAL